MDKHKHILVVPPKALSDPDAVEFIRAWRVGGGMHVSLNHSAWQKPETWGIALADILQHFADACEKSQGWPREDIIEKVAAVFNAELNNPTDKPKGEFLK